MNVQLPQKVGRPQKEFVAFATTQNGRWSEMTLRRRWQEANALETRRRRWEIENSAHPYSNEGRNTQEDVFDALREMYEIGQTFTKREAIAKFIEHTGKDISFSAMSNHLRRATDCGLLKCLSKKGGANPREFEWRRCR